MTGIRVVGGNPEFAADVTKEGLKVVSRSIEDSAQAAINGEKYNYNTGLITLTSANPSAIAWIRNDGNETLVIENFVVLLGSTSTGGTGGTSLTTVLNATAGTLISTATPMDIDGEPTLASGATPVSSTAYKGTEGATLTNGTSLYLSPTNSLSTIALSGVSNVAVLPRNTSLGLIYTPPSGNTSLTIAAAFGVYVKDA